MRSDLTTYEKKALRRIAKLVLKHKGGCWLWLGTVSSGYGQVWYDGKPRLVHRVIFTLIKGEISDGHEVDHTCRQPLCVRPSHLEAVTHEENVRRGTSWAAKNASKTKCPQGHTYDRFSERTGRKNPERGCKRCNRDRATRKRVKV